MALLGLAAISGLSGATKWTEETLVFGPFTKPRFCKEAVRTACSQYGRSSSGDHRGLLPRALACNYIGLHDDEIARLWRAFFPASHYDGARTYPDSDRASALVGLGRRPVFVSHEVYDTKAETYTIVDTVNYLAQTGLPLDNFEFQQVPLRNQTDRWGAHGPASAAKSTAMVRADLERTASIRP